MTESRIEEIAEKSNTVITSIKHIDCLLLGVQNHYKSGENDWSSRIIVSEDNFNVLSDAAISVPKGSYTVYYDSSMEYKLNATMKITARLRLHLLTNIEPFPIW